jgi:hypothetical protein
MSNATPSPSDDLQPAVCLCYCSPTTSWYTKNDRGTWIKASEQRAGQVLREAGFPTGGAEQDGSAQHEMNRLMRSCDVDYAGRLAGWDAGVHESNGVRFLVTSFSRPPAGRPGSWANLRGFLVGMLGEDQLLRFMCWLRRRRESLINRVYLEGQALALVGPAGCGKSFTQHLISEALGAAVAKPWRYMSGATTFNADLVCAEHLCVEDDCPGHDIRTRRTIGNAIKTMLYNKFQSVHPKGRDAYNLEPRWALSFSINDEPENVQVLPPVDESLEDKLTILKCISTPRRPPQGMTERRWLASLLENELPAMLHEVDRTETPDDWRDLRSGVSAYRHPDIMEILSNISPEAALRAMIDEHVTAAPWWEGSADALEALLRKEAPDRLRSVVRWQHAVAAYLARLSKDDPQRFQRRRTRKANLWRIMPPVIMEPVEPPVEG